MIIARSHITLSKERDISSVTWYYKLQPSTAAAPSKPTTQTPSGWAAVEPGYTEGSTSSLYIVEKTAFTDGTFAYSDVSLSSSYEAAKAAYNKAHAAQEAAEDGRKVATNYITDLASGVLVHPQGDTDNGLKITDAVNVIRDGYTTASYGSTTIFYKPGTTDAVAEVGSFGLKITDGIISLGEKTSASDLTNSGTYIDASGNIATSSIKATGGTVGGWTLANGCIYTFNNGKYTTLKRDGNVAFAAGSHSYSDTANAGIQIFHDGSMNAGYSELCGYSFRLDSNGSVYLQSYQAEACVTIDKGYIYTKSAATSSTYYLCIGEATIYAANGETLLLSTTNAGAVQIDSRFLRGRSGENIYGGYDYTGSNLYCYGNNGMVTRFATKTTTTTSTGAAFMVGNGYYAVGSSSDHSINANNTTNIYLSGGCDSTSRWVAAPVAYARTYGSAANVVITGNGVLGRSTSSSVRYKHDVEYLTNEDEATINENKKLVSKELAAARAASLKKGISDVDGKDNTDRSKPEAILRIPVAYFKYNEGYVTGEADFNYGKPIMGFIAEDVAKVCPECATYIKDEETGGQIPEAWDVSQLIIRMLYVMQKQQGEIEALKGGIISG